MLGGQGPKTVKGPKVTQIMYQDCHAALGGYLPGGGGKNYSYATVTVTSEGTLYFDLNVRG